MLIQDAILPILISLRGSVFEIFVFLLVDMQMCQLEVLWDVNVCGI